ncbi:MAG: deoxyguanosinetriphosphate triphosphohydrolase [Elusimicrobia bacterium]|nr:deoxyguanosinetriphosphate triphosphohydrolase [Elusimicrobiota bacterium]
MSIREEIEKSEEEKLSPLATKASKSRGRLYPEEESYVKTCFQRDRDRILNCLCFRKLKQKTQVFISTAGEEFRTRLTHTLEVANVAKTIAEALSLNADLAEAIALGHDLGHTPFGHTGEALLNQLYSQGFRHNEQSLRVVEKLERKGRGLNLTYEVKDGIVKHAKGARAITDIYKNKIEKPSTLEGEVVQFSDWIAYINHDTDDAFNMGVIENSDIPEVSRKVLGGNFEERIETILVDIIKNSRGKNHIAMSEKILDALEALRSFLYRNVYPVFGAKKMGRAKEIIRFLFDYCLKNPEFTEEKLYFLKEPDAARRAVDWISFLTDKEAEDMYRELKS